jgi:hypothetical protein
MGKSTIIYVIGLATLLLVYTVTVMDTSTRAVANAAEYYARTASHTVAVAGANIGTHYVLMGTDSVASFAGGMNGVTFAVAIDSLGAPGTKRVTAISSNTYFGRFGESVMHDTVVATFRRLTFSRYGYFSQNEVNGYLGPASDSSAGGQVWKGTGDSLFGYAHTNSRWNLEGRPYFDSKATAFHPPQSRLQDGIYDPVFNGGTEWGISVPRPSSVLGNLETAASTGFPSALYTGNDVALTFFADGRVHVKIPASSGAVRNDTLSMAGLMPNGVLAVKGADLRVSGSYHGQATLVALSGSASTKGNIWVDGDLVAATDPSLDQSSPDMLGLVAERMAYVTSRDPATGNLIPRDESSVVRIQAAIYCQRGILAAQSYDSLGPSGRVMFLGTLTMNAAALLGIADATTLHNGFRLSLRYDARFLTTAPPGFPVSAKYELVSWWEN